MSDALALIDAVTGKASVAGPDAKRILEAALEREVDPLHYCAATLGLGQVTVMERAAAWAGFAFYDVIPRGLSGQAAAVRLEELANARVVSMRLIDRDVFFSAPNYFEILALGARLRERPQLRGLLCFVPDNALRDYLVRASSVALIDGARQGLARRWPFATAQLELTIVARLGFVAALALLFTLVLLVPFIGSYALLPLTIFTLVAPAALKLAATAHGLRASRGPALVRPDDAELPVYSVLIPLRDEAHMVPQLYLAMCALD